MPASWQIRAYDRQQLAFDTAELAGPLEMGRQGQREAAPYHVRRGAGRPRLVLARLDEDTISPQHALLEPLADDKIWLTNLSEKLAIRMADGSDLKPGEARELPLPAVLTLGKKAVRVRAGDRTLDRLESLPEATIAPGSEAVLPGSFRALAAAPGAEPGAETLLRWLQAALGVLQSAATKADFFAKAARAVVDLVGMDSGHVLLLEGDDWKRASHVFRPPQPFSSELPWYKPAPACHDGTSPRVRPPSRYSPRCPGAVRHTRVPLDDGRGRR